MYCLRISRLSKWVYNDRNTDKIHPMFQNIWELFSYRYINKKVVWKYYYVIILILSSTNPVVKIAVLLTGFRICNNISTLFWTLCFYRPICLQKGPKLDFIFYLSTFLNLIFKIPKVSFLKNFWFFETLNDKDVHFLPLENQLITCLWTFMLSFAININISVIWLT